MPRFLVAFSICWLISSVTFGHDTWVQTNTNLIRTRDAIHIDLMLGNHGNEHRDFKLASKIDLTGCSLKLRAPGGRIYDLKDQLTDTGYTPKEGFWTTRFGATEPGLYTVEHSADRVVNHGKPVRSIRSAKSFFVVSPSLDKVSMDNPGFEKPFGHALELVPTANPVTPMGPGKSIEVRLLFKGQPLPNTRVSFIPRGQTLAAGFDDKFERRTNEKGEASFTPTEGNYYLVVAHHNVLDEKSADYDQTNYTATMTVFVPDVCPCCGE